MIWGRSPGELSWMPLPPEGWEGWRKQLLLLRGTGLLLLSLRSSSRITGLNLSPKSSNLPDFPGLWHQPCCQRAVSALPTTLAASSFASSSRSALSWSCDFVQWTPLEGVQQVSKMSAFILCPFSGSWLLLHRNLFASKEQVKGVMYEDPYQKIFERGTFPTCQVCEEPKDTITSLYFAQLQNCKCRVTPFPLDFTLVHQERNMIFSSQIWREV